MTITLDYDESRDDLNVLIDGKPLRWNDLFREANIVQRSADSLVEAVMDYQNAENELAA